MKKLLNLIFCTALLMAGLTSCVKIDINKYQLHTYDALSGESNDRSGYYMLDLEEKNTYFRFTT